MMVFPASMHPQALLQNSGKPFSFTCDICSTAADGTRVEPDGEREDWAILPEEWTEVEDRSEYAKTRFLIVCQDGDCQHTARSKS